MAGGGVKKTRGPLGFQQRDDITDQFVFGECLRFTQTEEFLNPRERLKMGPRETRDGHFLPIGKTAPLGDFAGSTVGQ